MADAKRLHLYHGPDAFSAREAVRELREELGVADSNVVRLDDKATVGDIATAAHTATFFAEPRLVILESLSKRSAGRRRSGRQARSRGAEPSSETDQVIDVLSALPDSTTVVLIEEKPAPSFLEAFKGIAKIVAFPIKRGDEMKRWAAARVQAAGGTISSAAVERLCEMVDGSHLGELAQEVDKLVTYVDGRRIEVADVEEVGSGAISRQTFDLTDAVVAGNARKALQVLQQMTEKEHPKQLLLSMIVRQHRQVLLTQDLVREGLSAAQMAGRLGIGFPFPMSKIIEQASRYPADLLERAYRRLLEADAAVKTGLMDIDTAVDVLIVDLAEIANAGRRQGPAATARRRG